MRILLVQLRRLGDLVLTTPAIAAIRRQFLDAEIVLAVANESASLLPGIDTVNRAVVIGRGMRDLSEWVQIARRRFDWAIDFTRNDRSAYLVLLSRARNRVVSYRLKDKSEIRSRLYNQFVHCAMKHMHTADYNLALLRPLGIESASADPVLDVPPTAHRRAATIVATQLGNKPFAVFHPGSAREEKFWHADGWAKVIEFTAREFGLHPVLSGGSSQMEREHLGGIQERLDIPVTDLAGKLDLLTLAALLSRARLLVTVDSVPMHLASAMKTPQVVLFGPTNPFHWRPRTSPAAILLGNSGPLQEFQERTPKLSMKNISTEAVIDAIRSMQSAPAASAV